MPTVSLPLLLFSGLVVWEKQRTQRRVQEIILVNQARDASQFVDDTFIRLRHALSTLADSTALAQGNLDSFRQELDPLATQFSDARLNLAAPNGEILLRRGNNRRFGLLPVTREGPPAVRAFAIAPRSGYVVVVAVPKVAFEAPVHRALLQTVLVGVGLLLAGVLAALFHAQRLLPALRAIARNASCGLREVDEFAAGRRAAPDEREPAQATLHDSESRDLVATLDLGTVMARDLEGTIRFRSHGCERMYSWTREQAVGRSSHELLRTVFPIPLKQIDHALLTDGEWSGDLVHQRRDGKQIIAAVHKALRRGPDGHPHSVMGSLVDVTALRQAQEALRTLNQELEQRVQDEVAARQAAQARAAHADRIQALGQIAGGVAHDFNNVLQAVAGGAALIARRPRDYESVTRLAQIVRDAAARGSSITRRMLVLARRSQLHAEPIEVEQLLVELREVFVHTLGVDICVRISIAPKLPRLMADRAQLETALVNLATNARDAMPDGGILRLEAALDVIDDTARRDLLGLAPGGYLRLSVVDAGTGMTAATLARVGEPFFTTKDVGKGTGLGLSMVKGFAEQSGGAFVVESAVGIGTTATLWLPSVAEEIRHRHCDCTLDRQPCRKGRILLVDDDQPVRDTLMEQLHDLGHKVLAASGGASALAILRTAQEPIDLMITDLAMPGMDGLALIEQARGLQPCLPAILLTGYAHDPGILAGGETAYTVMRKPVAVEVLNAHVIKLLDRP